MNIASAIFDRSAPDLNSCPDESLPEFAFIGRSNVGKSSLLNMLAGRNGLARVSPTPGFTKLINFFTINKTWRLVDLPGYGYAKLARKDKALFNHAVNEYLRRRPNLCCVFALIDSGLPPQNIDVEFVQWLTSHSIPFVLVFTKIDAEKSVQVEQNVSAFTEVIGAWFVKPPAVLTCSAKSGQGRRALLEVIESSINTGPAVETAAPAEFPPATEPLPEEPRAPRLTILANSNAPRRRVKGSRPW